MILLRCLKLYSTLARFSLSRTLNFWADSVLRVVMDVLFYIVSLSFFSVIYLHADNIGGFTRADAMVFVGCFTLIDALFMTFFSVNLWGMSAAINQGQLDYILTKPIPPFFLTLFQRIEFGSLINALMSASILAWALTIHPQPASWLGILLGLSMLPLAVWLYFMIGVAFVLPVFWTHSPGGFLRTFYSVEPLMERPDGIYRKGFGWVFFTLLPFAILASFPARAMVGKLASGDFFYYIFVLIAFTFVVARIWARGLRIYSSASS